MNRLTACLLLFVLVAPAFAKDDPAGPSTAERVASAVVRAVEAKDEEGVRALTLRIDVDPWLVFDALLERGAQAAAEQYVGLAEGPLAEGLAAYAKSATGLAQSTARRKTLRSALEKRAGEPKAALAALGKPTAVPHDISSIRVELLRGALLGSQGRVAEAAQAFDRAAKDAAALGWRSRVSEACYGSGLALWRLSDFEGALVRFKQRLVTEEALASKVGRGRAHYGIAQCLLTLGHMDTGKAHERKAKALFVEGGDHEYRAKVISRAGTELALSGDVPGAIDLWTKARAALAAVDASALEWRFAPDPARITAAKVDTLTNSASMSAGLQRYDDAQKYAREAMRLARAARAPRLLDETRAALARIEGAKHYADSRPFAALTEYERARGIFKRLGMRTELADVLRRVAISRGGLGDTPRAYEAILESIAMLEETQSQRELAIAHADAGQALLRMGRAEEAEGRIRKALTIARNLEDYLLETSILSDLADVYQARSGYTRALEVLHQVMQMHQQRGENADAGHTLLKIAHLHNRLKDVPGALAHVEQVMSLIEAGKTVVRREDALRSKALILSAAGQYEEVVGICREIYERRRAAHDLGGSAHWLYEMGDALKATGKYEEADRAYETAGGIFNAAGNTGMEINCRLQRGRTLLWRKNHDYDRALEEISYALEQAEGLSSLEPRAWAYAALSEARCVRHEFPQAVEAAKQGLNLLAAYGLDRAESEGIAMRSNFSHLTYWGGLAAYRARDHLALYSFFEQSRATSLVAALGGRKALNETQVPAALRAQEEQAKGAAAAAYHGYEEARRSGDLKLVRQRRKALAAARARQWDAVAAIERTIRAKAGLHRTQPPTIAELQAGLDPDAALVLYGRAGDRYLALVIQKNEARRVDLVRRKQGQKIDWDELPDTLEKLADNPADGALLQTVRELAWDPLRLDDPKTRVLISPFGRLTYVPFGQLAPSRAIALVPSLTAWHLLRKESRGAERVVEMRRQVLAMGDASYANRPPASVADKPLLRGGRLSSLPQTRIEAEAVGDVVFLGAEASETKLKSLLGEKKRWRAIHIACHGIVDDVVPSRSALVLTHDEQNDGWFHANEVFAGTPFQCDLVVLSACETSRGRLFGGEGLVGMARAFMLAGSPRVLASLWKVDDEATRALMVKFYELWNPKKGTGLGAAEALQQAQAFVRGHPKWKDPHYWAAWVLWGLPD